MTCSQNMVLDPALFAHKAATVLDVRRLDERHTWYELELADGSEIDEGEFIAIYVPGIGEAPISLCSSGTDRKKFAIAVRRIDPPEGLHDNHVVDTLLNVTSAIHHRTKVGDELLIRGPFGNQFPIHEFYGREILCIAGGIGLFPVLRPLLEIAENRNAYRNVSLLFGTDFPQNRYFPDLLDQWSTEGTFTVMEIPANGGEGYVGETGFVTKLIPKVELADPASTVVYVVGPGAMFKPVINILEEQGVLAQNIYFSLERQMRCCTGQCGHCRINSELICVDGPVYALDYIRNENLWEAL